MSGIEQDQNYKVGKGKPPKNKQWKKGQSGNPGGRPAKVVGPKSLHDCLAEELLRPLVVNDNGQPVALPMIQLISKLLVRDSAASDPKLRLPALRELSRLGGFDAVARKVEQRTMESAPRFVREEHRILLEYADEVLRELGEEDEDH